MAQVGALRVTLGANTAQYEAGMKRAAVTARTTAGSIQRSLASIKSSFGVATAGLIGTATIAGLVSMGKQALELAASLGETAQQLGVTTEALQVYRFAGSQVGLTTEEVDAGLARLTRTAGDAAAGVKGPAEAFNLLGINVRTANGHVKDTDRLMREVADGLSKIEDPARRAAIEVDLFGKAGQKLDTLLSGGSKAIDELRKAAHDLGIVLSDKQIQDADKTADKLEELKLVLSARISGVVADNASSIYELANALSDLTSWAIRALGAWTQFTKVLGAGNAARGAAFTLGGPIGIAAGIPGAIQNFLRNRGKPDEGVTIDLVTPPKPFQSPSAAGLNRIAGGGGGRKGKSAEQLAAEAARKREEALRRAFEADNRIANAKADELRAQQDLTDDYVDRADISRQLIDIETDQQNKQLALAVALGDLDKNVADELVKSNERLRILKKQQVLQEVELDRQRDFEATQQTVFNIQRDKLQAEAALAETAAERRRVELEILDLAYRERKERLERIITESRDAEERHRAQLELNSLPAQRVRDTAGVIQGTRGPLEAFQASLPTTAEKMNEALQLVAVDGLQALEQGILDVIDGTKSLGDAFRDVASQIIAELLRIQLQRAIIGPLSNVLGGLLGTGGGLQAGDAAGLIASNPGLFANGGYTGNMPTRKIAGFVHGREFVFDAPAVAKIGVGNLEAIRQGLRPGNDNTRSGKNGSIFNINVTAPNTGDPKRDRITAMQQASLIRTEVARASRNGF